MTRSLTRWLKVSGAALVACALIAPSVSLAQDGCGCNQAYRIVYKTVYDQEPVTTYRLQYETQMVERPITVQKPVWETEVRVRRFTVQRPVTETSERVEQVTVMRPVWETTEQEFSFDRVTYVTETQNRVERFTTMKPVYETQEREEQVTVRREVQETVMQQQQQTVFEPVTTTATQFVDQGGFVDQSVVVPGRVSNRLGWVPGGASVSQTNGVTYFRRGGLHWIPTQAPATTLTQRVFVPNVVAQQVQQTQMVAKVVTNEVPVQVTRLVDQVETRRVPVQTVRYEQQQHERQVPVTVQRPVVERVVERRPIRTCKMVQETQERRTPITVQRMVTEEREEQIPVKVCRMVTEERVVQEPRTVAKWVATEATRMTPRVVAMRVPLDGCGEIESTYMPSEGTVTRRVIVDPTPAPAATKPKIETQRPMVETPPAPEPDENTSGEPEETEAPMATDSITREPETKVVPRTNTTRPKVETPTDKDPTGTPMLNGPNPAKRTPTPADNEA